jgi:hypothetical protein
VAWSDRRLLFQVNPRNSFCWHAWAVMEQQLEVRESGFSDNSACLDVCDLVMDACRLVSLIPYQ